MLIHNANIDIMHATILIILDTPFYYIYYKIQSEENLFPLAFLIINCYKINNYFE